MKPKFQLRFDQIAPDADVVTGEGRSLRLSDLWQARPIVLAFIRHFGCPQCKTLLDHLYQLRPKLEENNLGLVVVTQGTQEETAAFCAERIPGTLCLADPTRSLYRAYGVGRGGLRETFLSAEVWRANARAAKKGYKAELPPKGQDAMLMSALFVIGPDGRIRLPYYYDHIADHPPVEVLLSGFLGTRWEQPFNGAIHTEGGAHGD